MNDDVVPASALGPDDPEARLANKSVLDKQISHVKQRFRRAGSGLASMALQSAIVMFIQRSP
ncbi:MAG: hypothetical protein H7Y28_05530 [Rhodoferax sp.]|nr:hypothetical protein [Rhodoferax sp.]